jgi:hypothetical protein
VPNTNSHGAKRAILYARVSTDEQAKNGYSLAQQLEALRDYAVRESYGIQVEIQDPGQSGASLMRPGMDRVRDLVREGISIAERHPLPRRRRSSQIRPAECFFLISSRSPSEASSTKSSTCSKPSDPP